MEKAIKEKLERVIGDMANHIRGLRFGYCQVVFATSDDVCWELVTGYEDDYDGCNGDIRVVKWTDGKPAHVVSFPTDYCFDRYTGMCMNNELESLQQRMLEFFENEV